ncbi:MAG: radical SAM protein [SAR324 cluster bacterium]|nr:radical SAM protein [SAR324 cluster bacterium]
MTDYHPEQIIVDRAVFEENFTQKVLSKLSNVPYQIVDSYVWHKDEAGLDPKKNDLTLGKKTLHLKHFAGMPIKLCPGSTEEAVCCNYFTIDFIENCPLECSYCILQAFLNKPVITVHANISEILNQVRERVEQQPRRLFRIGTGEHSDSLAMDPLLEINTQVVPFFGALKNAVLELKTKSVHIDHLLNLPHQGNTVISWSLNPKYIVEHEEHKTARLHERLSAAQKVIEAGYKVAFHFDPMIYYPDWEAGYTELVDLLMDSIPPEKIAWISLGTLRYIPRLKTVVEERFPKSKIFLGEFIRGEDGKMRYMKKIRQRMFQAVRQRIHKRAPHVTTYLCMEKEPVWKQTMSNPPGTDLELDRYISHQYQQQFYSACSTTTE